MMEIVTEEIDRDETPFGTLRLVRFETVPEGEHELAEHGYEIWIDDAFLMASHGFHSERAMARLAWQRLTPPRAGLRVLIGGLGAGHTLRAVLDLDGVERVVVAEISAKVVEWARTELAPFNGAAVADPRVTVEIGDVGAVLSRTAHAWDLVLLDVDNGPGWLATPGNVALYEKEGVADAIRSLRTGGVLAVWSPAANAVLEATLNAVAGGVQALDTAAEGRACQEPGSTIYLAWS